MSNKITKSATMQNTKYTKMKWQHSSTMWNSLGRTHTTHVLFGVRVSPRDFSLSPAHTVRFWPRFGRLRQILKILKDSYNPRLKSVVFDRWFDMFTDSRLMAVAIKFHLRRNSGSVRRIGAQSCSVTTPTINVKLSPFFKTSYEQN